VIKIRIDLAQSIFGLFCVQGDQIGRNFAHRVIIYFRQFLEITEVVQIIGPCQICINIVQNGFGNILGDFFHKLIWSPCRRV
jgi:hypothetical protein